MIEKMFKFNVPVTSVEPLIKDENRIISIDESLAKKLYLNLKEIFEPTDFDYNFSLQTNTSSYETKTQTQLKSPCIFNLVPPHIRKKE